MINNHRTSSSKMEDIRQILLRNPELTHEEELHYHYQYNFLNNNLTSKIAIFIPINSNKFTGIKPTTTTP